MVSARSEKPISAPSRLSFRSFPNAALNQFQSLFVWLMMALSRPFKEDCQAFPLSASPSPWGRWCDVLGFVLESTVSSSSTILHSHFPWIRQWRFYIMRLLSGILLHKFLLSIRLIYYSQPSPHIRRGVSQTVNQTLTCKVITVLRPDITDLGAFLKRLCFVLISLIWGHF